ncbi:MAG: hypothetical protein ACREMY_32800, partial [bacterium]
PGQCRSLPPLVDLEELLFPFIPEESTEPERRLGSSEISSLRPMFFPKFDCDSSFDLSSFERFKSPPLVLPTFLSIFSRSRFSMCYLRFSIVRADAADTYY